MHEAVQLHYIRNGLNCVIEQFSIYVFKCCTRATTPKLLENRLNGQNCQLEIVSAFRKSLGICSSLTGTYFKIQSKLTHFIKSTF